MENLEKLRKEVETRKMELATLQERNRILLEIKKANLPLGVWPLIKNIINPK